MVVFGLVLVALGALLVLLGLFVSDVKVVDGEATIEIWNVDLSIEGVFLAGVIAAALVLVGLWVVKFGAKQNWKQRKEHKKLNELSEKLERAESGRRKDEDDGDPVS
jgi:hypothetical protein